MTQKPRTHESRRRMSSRQDECRCRESDHPEGKHSALVRRHRMPDVDVPSPSRRPPCTSHLVAPLDIICLPHLLARPRAYPRLIVPATHVSFHRFNKEPSERFRMMMTNNGSCGSDDYDPKRTREQRSPQKDTSQKRSRFKRSLS